LTCSWECPFKVVCVFTCTRANDGMHVERLSSKRRISDKCIIVSWPGIEVGTFPVPFGDRLHPSQGTINHHAHSNQPTNQPTGKLTLSRKHSAPHVLSNALFLTTTHIKPLSMTQWRSPYVLCLASEIPWYTMMSRVATTMAVSCCALFDARWIQ
jgi:hypothetical protein